MTTTVSAIENTVAAGLDTTDLATITPVYAALRANRPVKGRMGGRSALLGSTIFAGAFGLFAAEAIAQQYNLPGSGGYTDVSSSINVVTDAGAGNIRVILSDGVSFLAGPGQYQLNPMTNQLQVATDVLLSAYTAGAPVQAVQATQAFSATQAFTPPPVYAGNAPLTLPQQTISGPQFTAPAGQQTYQPQVFTAGQYAAQPSIVGGYQMQPSFANISYNPPQAANMNPQPTQYVPAYSAGAQFAQSQATFGSPTASTFGTQGTFGGDTFGGMQPIPVSQVVPTNEVAVAPVAAAAAGGLFGLPTWAVVGGGAAAAGAAVLALGGLGGGESTTNQTNSANRSATEQSFLAQVAASEAAREEAAAADDDDDTSSSSGGSSGSSSGSGVTVTGASGGSTTSGSSSGTTDTTDSVAAGSSGGVYTGDDKNNTLIFLDGPDIEKISSIDLNGGDDTVELESVDENLDIPDLNDVENLEIELSADGVEIDLEDVGTELENVVIDAASSHDFKVLNADSVSAITVKNGKNESVDIDDVSDQSKITLDDSEKVDVAMKSSSDNELTIEVKSVTAADITVDTHVDDLTIISSGDDPNVIKNLSAASATTIEFKGAQDLELEEEIGDTNLPKVKTIAGSSAEGDLSLTLNGNTIDSVTLGDGGDDLTVDLVASDAVISTGDGNDDVTINDMPASGTVNSGDGADDIILNEALATGATIDGGGGTNDEITVNADITDGAVKNVEIINIGAAEVDLSKITGETDVNILGNITATVTALSADEVDTGSDAKVLIKTLASGASADFDAAGNLTIDSDTASLTDLEVDFGAANATLTLTDSLGSSANAATDLTLVGSGTIEVAGTATTSLKDIDASGASGAVNVTANAPTALTAYEGSSGIDTLTIDGVDTSATISLNGGKDVFVSNHGAGTVVVDGGAGTDSYDFAGAGNHYLKVTANGDVPSVTLTGASTAAALTSFEEITGFLNTTDEIDLSALNLSGKNDYTVFATMMTDLVTNDTYDVGVFDDTTDVWVVYDANGDNSTFNVIKLTGVTAPTVADVDII